jgi:hypothetical protein
MGFFFSNETAAEAATAILSADILQVVVLVGQKSLRDQILDNTALEARVGAIKWIVTMSEVEEIDSATGRLAINEQKTNMTYKMIICRLGLCHTLDYNTGYKLPSI